MKWVTGDGRCIQRRRQEVSLEGYSSGESDLGNRKPQMDPYTILRILYARGLAKYPALLILLILILFCLIKVQEFCGVKRLQR